MRWDDLRPSDNVQDRRGGFGGRGIVLGGGGLGMVAVIVVSLLFGVDPSSLLNGGSESMPGQRQPAGAQDASFDFSRRIVGSAEDVWGPLMQEQGLRFSPATFVTYDDATPTACGNGQASAGPFYCPSDQTIYVDLDFFRELETRFGAPGEFARAYVLAHEYGHHIQALMGTMDRHRAGERGADSDAVRMELQADCYAGVWAKRADQRFHLLEAGDVEQGLAAAASVGDDTLQKQGQGYVVPDSFTHGSSAQRRRWFQRGLEGDLPGCDTFAAGAL